MEEDGDWAGNNPEATKKVIRRSDQTLKKRKRERKQQIRILDLCESEAEVKRRVHPHHTIRSWVKPPTDEEIVAGFDNRNVQSNRRKPTLNLCR